MDELTCVDVSLPLVLSSNTFSLKSLVSFDDSRGILTFIKQFNIRKAWNFKRTYWYNLEVVLLVVRCVRAQQQFLNSVVRVRSTIEWPIKFNNKVKSSQNALVLTQLGRASTLRLDWATWGLWNTECRRRTESSSSKSYTPPLLSAARSHRRSQL